MKVHAETVEALIDLYNQCHQVLDEEFNIKTDGEDAMEAAAMDYMTCPQRSRFCCIVDNLDPEVCREIVALKNIGAESSTCSPSEFDKIKVSSATGSEAGRLLIDTQNLPELWRRALDIISN